jgi:hypothetical protein
VGTVYDLPFAAASFDAALVQVGRTDVTPNLNGRAQALDAVSAQLTSKGAQRGVGARRLPQGADAQQEQPHLAGD